MSASGTRAPRLPRRGALTLLAVLLALSSALQAHEELDAKIQAVTRQLEREPRSAWLYARRAELHRRHRDGWSAWRDLREARLLDPELVELVLVEARLLRDSRRPDEARAVLADLLAHEPQLGPAHVLHAELLVATGRPRAAVAAYDRALRFSVPSPDLFVARFAAAASGGATPREALDGLDEGLRRLGQVPALVLAAVELERRSGNTEAALTRIGRAGTSLAPWVAARLEGDVLLDADRTRAARAAYERSLRAVAALTPDKRRTPATREHVAAVRRALAENPEPNPSNR